MTTLALPVPVPAPPATDSLPPCTKPVRPAFHQRNTQDRLREGAGLYIAFLAKGSNSLQKNRRSVFRETGLEIDDDDDEQQPQPQQMMLSAQ